MITHSNFYPGPSQLYFTVDMHVRNAFREGIPTLSHRSKAFETLYAYTVEQIRVLLNIPSSHHIVFTSSATEIWECMAQNLVEKKSFHLVNGAFSSKFYNASIAVKKQAQKIQIPDGQGFEEVPETDAELIAVTHNETSTGVALSNTFLCALKDKNPHTLLAVDAVSSLPYANFDYSKIDSVYFSVQKGFGLPPGLGVWIVNERCIAKAAHLLAAGKNVGTYHSLPSLMAYGAKNQTPQTPNTLGIYLLGKVASDMLKKGIDTIRRETDYKTAILYQALKVHPKLTAFVKEKKFRSSTVVVAESNAYTESIIKLLSLKGVIVGQGYGTHKKKHLRFANFPTHSREQVEHLVDLLQLV